MNHPGEQSEGEGLQGHQEEAEGGDVGDGLEVQVVVDLEGGRAQAGGAEQGG